MSAAAPVRHRLDLISSVTFRGESNVMALQREDRLVFHFMVISLWGRSGLLSTAAVFKIRLHLTLLLLW